MRRLARLVLVGGLIVCTTSRAFLFGDSKVHGVMDNTLSIELNVPVREVFNYTVNPRNTPTWVKGVCVELTNDWPPRVGTIYRNRNKSGVWSDYKVTKYFKNKEFELEKQDTSTYHVNYTYSTSPNGMTNLVYHEWVTKGEIDGPFTQKQLNDLRCILEKKFPRKLTG